MKIRVLLSSVLLFLCTMTAFANYGTKHGTKSDQYVLGWIMVLDKNEIAAANLALKHKVSASIRDYAKMLRNTHTSNLQQTRHLAHQLGIRPKLNEGGHALKNQGKSVLAALKKEKGKEFGAHFVDAMVDGHTQALSQIDSDLKLDLNAKVKSQLEKTQAVVEKHLDAGKKLQG